MLYAQHGVMQNKGSHHPVTFISSLRCEGSAAEDLEEWIGKGRA
jgi:hypothetical protein